MGMISTITTELDDSILALVDQVADVQGRTRAQYVAEAIRRVAETDADFLAFVQVGIDAADRGELIDGEEVDRWFDERIAEHRRRCD